MNIYIKQLVFTIYEMQHQLNMSLIKEINHVNLFSFIFLLTGGMLNSFSPCMVSSFPIIASYLPSQKNNIQINLSFIFGIITSILAIGISIILINIHSINKLNNIKLFSSILYFIIGLNILEIFSMHLPINLMTKIQSINKKNLFFTYIFGISIGFNISPCNTPILTSLILWITHTKNILVSVIFLGIYTLGYLSPILLYLVSIRYFSKVQIPKFIWEFIFPFTGGLLITTSVFSLCQVY
uniref:Cytochrome c biogenesis protein transmembrane region n=1 Tax=Kumanoa americana TaxID=1196377 RepID=A0A1C9CGQ2_9FLOR|nr:cytochrome c biogenesis protein transmembrane region [Kumanoa americana]AOM67561.1 cytochrome c biogenesis protein transmembrane region [Kumanoa americana]